MQPSDCLGPATTRNARGGSRCACRRIPSLSRRIFEVDQRFQNGTRHLHSQSEDVDMDSPAVQPNVSASSSPAPPLEASSSTEPTPAAVGDQAVRAEHVQDGVLVDEEPGPMRPRVDDAMRRVSGPHDFTSLEASSLLCELVSLSPCRPCSLDVFSQNSRAEGRCYTTCTWTCVRPSG